MEWNPRRMQLGSEARLEEDEVGNVKCGVGGRRRGNPSRFYRAGARTETAFFFFLGEDRNSWGGRLAPGPRVRGP